MGVRAGQAGQGDDTYRHNGAGEMLSTAPPPRDLAPAAVPGGDFGSACCGQIKLLQIDFDSRWLSRSHYPTMSLTRPIVFWIAMLAAVIAAVVLLREILLPFVAGMVLAYLLDPLATRLERLGMNRLVATLAIVGLFIVGVVALIVLTAPIIVRELAYFIDNLPLYVRAVAGARNRSEPAVAEQDRRRRLGSRRAVDRRVDDAGDRLVRHFSAFGMVWGPSADLGVLARGRDPDRCLLSHL